MGKADREPQVVAELSARDVAMAASLICTAIRIKPPLRKHFGETSTRRAMARAHLAPEPYRVDADLANTCDLFHHPGIPTLM